MKPPAPHRFKSPQRLMVCHFGAPKVLIKNLTSALLQRAHKSENESLTALLTSAYKQLNCYSSFWLIGTAHENFLRELLIGTAY